MQRWILFAVQLLVAGGWPQFSGAKPWDRAAYERIALPVLQKYCADCHTQGNHADRWAFDGYPGGYTDLVADHKAWGKAEQLITNHLMPPQGAPAPSPAERRQILEWIDQGVFYVDPQRPDPGRTVLRRLNRAEYNNTIRDVFGIETHPANQFPADDAGYGFDNIGDVLSVSPLHLEKYLTAAREVAEEATRLAAPFRLGVDLPAERLTTFAGTPQLMEKALLLRAPVDEIGTMIEVSLPSVYRVLVRVAVAGGTQQHRPTVDVLLSGKKLAELRPTTPWTGKAGFFPGVSEFIELPAGKHRLSLRMAGPKSLDGQESDPPVAAVSFFEVSGPFTPLPPRPTAFLRDAVGTQPLGVPQLHLSGEDLNAGSGRSGLDTGRAWFASNGYRHGPLLLPQAGRFRIRLKVGAQQVGPEQARFEIRLGDRTVGAFTVTAGSQVEQWIETQCELPAGAHDWQVWFVNEYKDPTSGAERWFWLHEFTIEGPLEGDYGLTRAQAASLLKHTGRRLFRRPLTDDELQKLLRLTDAAQDAGHSMLAAVRLGLEALLVSPKFLYHPQPQPAGDARHGTALIDELTLAARLSYFLWSSTPDEELLALAERGQLRQQFAAQARRMLFDRKSAALTTNFAGQWLQLRDLERVVPDAHTFPEFDASLAADMRRESELLFAHILQENRPVREFLSADYSFLNARLARHYGLPAPAGEGFHRVSLAETPRRGVLTHGSVLTLTSHPTRTSPVKRGKWLLEQILGTHPPPAPRDVPPLPTGQENESLPLRVRLEQHRANAACASCHALLDPMGFALENYDAIGRWRTHEAGRKLDTGGRLITGESFRDWSQMRAWLIEHRQEDLLRCLTEHLLTFALGRGVTYHDKLAVREICTRCTPPDKGLQDLILAVCESVPFQRMRSVAP